MTTPEEKTCLDKDARRRADHLLLAALLEGKSLRDAAEAAGLSLSTATRRVRSPKFEERLEELRGRLVDAILARLSASAEQAASKMVGLLGSEDERVQLAAAKAIIDRAVDPWKREVIADLKDLRERLSQLEKDRQQQEKERGVW